MDDDLFVAGEIDEHRKLCISPLSSLTVEGAEVKNLGSQHGYYLYEVDDGPVGGGIQILAKVASLEAAFRLIEIWKSARRTVHA